MRLFDDAMRAEVQRTLRLAEDLCGDHFRLSAFDLRQAPYDVVTAVELQGLDIAPPPSPTQLAEVQRCDLTREERSARDRRRIHYRVCLWDPHILAAVDQGARAGALLLFLLVHELVHVVRFARRLARFESSDDEKQREEHRVHEATHAILERAREPGLRELLDDLPALGSCLRGFGTATGEPTPGRPR
ncbi:MAG: hypothetical protein ABIJ09_08620 [Pseudomonadota bacterium]